MTQMSLSKNCTPVVPRQRDVSTMYRKIVYCGRVAEAARFLDKGLSHWRITTQNIDTNTTALSSRNPAAPELELALKC